VKCKLKFTFRTGYANPPEGFHSVKRPSAIAPTPVLLKPATYPNSNLLFAGSVFGVCVFVPNLARFSTIMNGISRLVFFKQKKPKALRVPEQGKALD